MYEYGVSLTGGGARGSYQAGALKGLLEVLGENGYSAEKNILRHWSGVSAGSINASFIAAGLANLNMATSALVKLWSEIEPENVYLTDFTSLTSNGAKWVRDLTFGTLLKKKLAHSLLDTKPLWGYLEPQIKFSEIKKNIESGLLNSLSCSAYSYSSNRTVTFLQSKDNVSWNRQRRLSQKVDIDINHIMASCAIPLLFPTVKIDNEFYADGGFRNLSPISPLVHMNVRKIILIGVRGRDEFSEQSYKTNPTVAKISGAMLNALFFDTIDIDLERLRHINDLLSATQATIETKRSSYSKIDYMVIRPSRDISKIAEQNTKSFPRLIRFLMGGLGPMSESSELASYILFVPKFTRDLIELGYNDSRAKKEEILKWIETKVD